MEREYIDCGGKLSFTNPNLRDETIKLLLKIENLGDKKRFLLDFTNCEEICALTALYLFAIVTGRQHYSSKKICTIKLPKYKLLRREMEHLGFTEALCIAKKGKLVDLWSQSSFVCGNLSNTTLLKDAMKRELGLSKLPDKLATAIKETCLNVYHHAYGKPTRLLDVQWWSYFYKDNDEFGEYVDIGICDRGLGIPSTIKPLYQIGKPDDSYLIRQAMKASITSTRRTDRGKGSTDIIKPIKFMKNCNDKLLVLSGNTGIYYRMSNAELVDSKLQEFKSPIKGTLVQWRLYLN